ncbi:hypothetical protein V1264_021633 [Littorina saxatilis]|uniref:G-protein coupled receptors family 1 profile domain-containing protein n=2 Tax=Littorina saxatilis TaxID=31220 RepID=A0AAN9FW45_9CAEN
MGVVMVLSGFIGNCLLLLVIFKQFKRHQSVHILFVANLSLADLVTMGYWFTFFVLDLILNRQPVVNYAHCVFNGVLVAAMYLASVSFLVSISLNRYLHVCHFHLYSRVFTLPRTVAWCLLVWLGSFFIAFLPVVDNMENTNYRYNPVTRFCSYNRARVNYTKIIALVYAIFPMLFVAYCNFAIFRYWKRGRLRTSQRNPLVERMAAKRQKLVARVRGAVKRDKGVCSAAETITERNEEPVEPTTSEVLGPDAQGTVEIVNNRDLNPEDGKSVESVYPSQCQNSDEAECTVSDTDPDAIVYVADGKVRVDDENSDHSLSSGPVDANSEDLVNGCEENLESEDNEVVACPGRQFDAVETQSSVAVDDIENTSQQPPKCPEAAKKGATPSLPTPTIHIISGPPPMRRKRTPAKQAEKIPRTAKQDAKERAKGTKSREVAFVRSLFVVFLLAVVTFIPYGAMTVLGTLVSLSSELVILGNLFLFFNNSVNWIVYGVMSPAFRQGYVHCSRKILTACCSWNKACREVMKLNVSLSSLVRPTAQGSNVTTSDISPSTTSQTSL